MSIKEKNTSPISVGMISLGCAKNLVDSEIMLGHLMQAGMTITNNADDADVVVVNTCSFIDSAQEESVDTILESSELRKAKHLGQGLIVAGCLTQRYRKELPELLPEVDVFMGIDQVDQIPEFVRQAHKHREKKINREENAGKVSDDAATNESEEMLPVLDVTARPNYIPDYTTPRFRLTPQHFAYLKIAEGCNHPCSFCIIPRMRGSHRSRQPEDIVQEAKAMVRDGIKEINLISQDSTYYGMDLRENHKRNIASPQKFKEASEALPEDASTLSSLLRQLNAIEGDFWIRILYTHPAHWTDELIQTIAECKKVAKYVDIPLQHIHSTMLERMRRETSREYIEELIQRIREGIPNIAIRTTFIVGFPGETEGAFESLKTFIQDTRFERLGVFTYSHEEGTRAGDMANQIPVEVKEARKSRAMETQLEVSRELASAQVGKMMRVLVEGPADAAAIEESNIRSWEHGLLRSKSEKSAISLDTSTSWSIARGEADAPDIDGRIYVQGRPKPHQFHMVQITGFTDYDLIAELATESEK
ncbi:30S ribosomal protein S12 methylthiotransferase RimO [Verrucomicrobia bacterium]|nr:30S ribosomal protein S12 methylthiotransferase RimO [bacterium]MDC0263579.1 30S ribosomal protein S12 methylthiotransferase RimO [Verrucomicrobiota bacterium]